MAEFYVRDSLQLKALRGWRRTTVAARAQRADVAAAAAAQTAPYVECNEDDSTSRAGTHEAFELPELEPAKKAQALAATPWSAQQRRSESTALLGWWAPPPGLCS